MSSDKEQLQNLIKEITDETGASPPAAFLVRVMSGEDPRKQGKTSELFDLVFTVCNEMRRPDDWEWERIEELVIESDLYRPAAVSFKASLFAAEELMKYQHAKLKSIDLSANINMKVQVVEPLTYEDVETFEASFWSKF